MTEEVAIRMFRWETATIHETGDDGQPNCRMGDQDITFRTYQRDELPDDLDECSFCFGEVDKSGGDCGELARALSHPDVSTPEDLEEVRAK